MLLVASRPLVLLLCVIEKTFSTHCTTAERKHSELVHEKAVRETNRNQELAATGTIYDVHLPDVMVDNDVKVLGWSCTHLRAQ